MKFQSGLKKCLHGCLGEREEGKERMRGRKREWRLEVEGGVQTSSIFSLPTPAFHLPPRGSDSALQNST